MALRKLEADLSIISKLGNNPGPDDGLNEEQLKAKFDEAVNIIKDYINNYLILEIDKTVDVDSLLSDLLDTTFSKSDKAANAKAVGDSLRELRSFFERVVHSGNYVLKSDGFFAAENVGSNTIRVMGGEGVMQGNLFALNIGAYKNVKLTAGTPGLRRSDLIVIRCTKDENGALSYDIINLTGTNTSGDPVDPAYIQGDINAEDINVCDFPLYRVMFEGSTLAGISPLFEAERNIKDYVEDYFNSHSKRELIPAILAADSWSDAAPFTQTTPIEGITVEDTPHVSPVYSDDLATALAQKEAWAMVSRGKPGENAITFICFEDKPAVDIPIQIEVNR